MNEVLNLIQYSYPFSPLNFYKLIDVLLVTHTTRCVLFFFKISSCSVLQNSILCFLSATIFLIPFPSIVVEVFYGIELLASFLIPILLWRNKRTAMPKWILVFIVFASC